MRVSAAPLYVVTTALGILCQPRADAWAQAPAAAPAAVLQGQQSSLETAVYNQLRRSVFKIQAGAGHGSGFLIDSALGLVVTNQHVINDAQANEISVFVDSVTRVPAQVMASDHNADLALLRVRPDFVADRPALVIAVGDSGRGLVEPGEHVLALGFPLSQQLSISAGIVSSVRRGAVTSDVRINHGNSGGPLVNLRAQVVGINTFLEIDEGTAGISGAVSPAPLAAMLSQARLVAQTTPPPIKRLLPQVPASGYPVGELQRIADTSKDRVHESFSHLECGNFDVTLATPVSALAEAMQAESALWSARTRRESRAPVVSLDQLRESGFYRDWEEYVGGETAPAVELQFVPQVGRTTGTTVANIFGALAAGLSRTPYVQGTQRMEFKGDVEWVRFYRNGDAVEPVLGGRTPQRVWVSNVFVEMRDVAYRGIYFLRPEVFAPDSTGRPPSVIFVIGDLNHPKDQVDCEIEPAVASRAWNDFLPYFRTVGLGNVPRADATKRFASLKEGFCDAHDCSGGDAVEYGPSAGVRLAGWVVDGGGVLVGWVPPASRTWRAGLRPGDVIVKTDGHAASDVQGVVFALSQGAALPRLLIRRQDRLAWLAEGSDSVLSGLQVTSESAPSRVRVRDVRPGSVIATAGLRSGDYIVSIDGQPAATVEGLDDLLQRNRTGHWRLGIRRGSDSLAIAL